MNTQYDNWIEAFGFNRDPYDTRALDSEYGNALLVGREKETKLLRQRITSQAEIPLLVGKYGVGKTSLANVVAYYLCNRYNEGDRRYFFLNARSFSGSDLSDIDTFECELLRHIAILLEKEPFFLDEKGISQFERRAVKAKVQSLMHQSTANVGAFSFGVTVGVNQDDQPFQIIVKEWLTKCFPRDSRSGIICILDNLESYGTPRKIVEVIQNNRDRLFSLPGLIWIICGTEFSVKEIVNSAQLNGYIKQLVVSPINSIVAPEIIERRYEYCGEANALLPLDGDQFVFLYELMNNQLRAALTLAREFAEYLFDNASRQHEDRKEELLKWLNQKAALLPERENEITQDAWDLFDSITGLKSDILSSNYSLYSMGSVEELDRISKILIDKHLIEKIMLDDGFLLKVTVDGWLVCFRRTCIV